jgi:hypothetical protein
MAKKEKVSDYLKSGKREVQDYLGTEEEPFVKITTATGCYSFIETNDPVSKKTAYDYIDSYVKREERRLANKLNYGDERGRGAVYCDNQTAKDLGLLHGRPDYLRVAYRATPNLTLGGEASFTGDAIVNDGHYDIKSPDRFSFFGKAEYYEPYTRLQGQLMGGRFVFGDYGVRLDISRHFSDYTIGLYGILTGGEHNGGFHFAIPLGPKRQMRRGKVRLKLPDYFDWEYSMVSYYEYYDQQMGKYIETRPDENRSAHYWQPVHVAQYAQKLLNGEIK